MGGSSGIGFASAQAFIQAGANVWITGKSEDNLLGATSKFNSAQLKTVVADTSSLAGVTVLEQAVVKSKQPIHVLLLNAAIGVFAPIESAAEAEFDALFNTNVKGPFLPCKSYFHT